MLPSDKARTIAARIAASLIRQEARCRSFMEIYLGATDQEQVAVEMCQLAATLEVLCAGGGVLTSKPNPT